MYMVNNPPHYNRKNIEAVCAIEASMDEEEFRGYLKGNTLKYIWRYKYKDQPVEDLEKAVIYLQNEITHVKRKNLPRYNETDVLVFSGSGIPGGLSNNELKNNCYAD